ncbi:MAG: 50S ribosomal protein L29 [Candidatus Lokiarchaeota archaeon]|nr:50S ribosomal protein L29 [Candidatus Lokiarchaeota archaeon]
MKILRPDEIRNMSEREIERTLTDLREELMMLYSMQTGGGLSDNPAKAKMLRRQIARVLTIKNERAREEEEWEEEFVEEAYE